MAPSRSSIKPSFRAAAVASGLVSRGEMDKALEELRAAHGEEITQEQIAAKLIEQGRLNFWQAEQLVAGRSKFHLGPYRIMDSIGQGGMGQVFKGEHTIMRRVVAIKVLPRSKATPESIANFTREIQAQAQLDHENLVRAFDAGRDGSVHFLVTEYVPGTDLRRLIRRNGKLSMQSAAAIISQAAHGLDHAHSRGLIHRDVKPGNLLVTPQGRTKVSDLGLAGYFDRDPEGDRETKIVGTADYLSPEQILTPDKLTPACDIYALGCTLYYAVTGKVPYPGGTSQDKARAHCKPSIQPIDPRRLNPDLSDEFVEVIAAMMVKNPAERLPNASAVISRLTPWAGEIIELSGGWLDAPTSRTPLSPFAAPSEVADLGETRPLDQDEEADLLEEEQEEPSDASQISQISQISQLSQRTWPMASAGEETMPMFDPYPRPAGIGLTPGVLILIAIGLGTALLALSAVVILTLL